MTDPEALAVLEDAHRRCAAEDMRTLDVYHALDQLQASAELLAKNPELWPFDQFRRTLGAPDVPFAPNAAGRGQVLNASLNGIYRLLQVRRVLQVRR